MSVRAALHPGFCSEYCTRCRDEEAAAEVRDRLECDAPIWTGEEHTTCGLCARCLAPARYAGQAS